MMTQNRENCEVLFRAITDHETESQPLLVVPDIDDILVCKEPSAMYLPKFFATFTLMEDTPKARYFNEGNRISLLVFFHTWSDTKLS
jgi:hypothetical protein